MMSMRDIDFRELIVMTNGVLGISILTMPFCFQQCGILLGALSLMVSAFMTSYSCKLLVRIINIKKTKSFEFLALRIFGHKAKLLLEISIILLLFGSLVTYHQTVSDSGPNFLTKLFNLSIGSISRTWFMVIFTLTTILPLSLLKKLDNINKLSILAIFFYFILGFYLFWEALNKISFGLDLSKITIWNFEGLLKCFPIFSISFSCQTVLFTVYNELTENSKNQLPRLSDRAILISFSAYFLSGFFGYLAFCDIEIPGNVITIIPESFMSQTIIFGFIVCVVSGFPFMIFPCRTSLNTLFFSTDSDEIIETELYIPEARFKYLTYSVVFSTALVAVAIPNMEFVLSFTGATAGSLICYVWPSILYIYAVNMSKDTQKDVATKVFLIMGIVIFCICTTATMIEYQPSKPEVPQAAISENLPLDKIEKAYINNQNENENQMQMQIPPNEQENQFLPRESGPGRSLMSYTFAAQIKRNLDAFLSSFSNTSTTITDTLTFTPTVTTTLDTTITTTTTSTKNRLDHDLFLNKDDNNF